MAKGTTHNHTPEIVHYTFGPHEPVLRVAPGDRINTKTMDSGNRDENLDEIPETMRGRRDDTAFRESNPLTGPFYVEGSEPGDVLAVRIASIVPNREISCPQNHRRKLVCLSAVNVLAKRILLVS